MKILQVSESDNIGGAAIAASKLNCLLNKNHIDSKLLVNRKKTNDFNIISPFSFFDKIYAKILPHLLIKYNKWRFGTTKLTISKDKSSLFFLRMINNKKFDIIHLHWVNNGFVGLDDLNLITKPIVWTLHDNWLFTAGCHSTQGCKQFVDNCNNCPHIAHKQHQINLDKQFVIKNRKLLDLKKKINIIVPSKWMLASAKESKILNGFNITLIPNFIDVDLFIPKDRDICKQYFNLELKKKYILFGATDPINDSNKGYDYIKEMDSRGVLDGFTLIIFGKIANSSDVDLNIDFILMDTIYDKKKLALLYNVAELIIMPSIHESFGQVAAEGMACGIPVLCFNTTGLKDIVDHKKNGYLAILKDIDDLITGFNWIVSQKGLGVFTRSKIENKFSKDIILKKHIELYQKILKINT